MSKVTRRGFLKGSIAGTAGVAALTSTPGRNALAAGAGGKDLVVVQTSVNGKAKGLTVTPDQSTADTLRNGLGLMGTKLACGAGSCGACTVLIDGKATVSCLLPATALEGAQVKTVEGVATGGKLHPVQRAFMAHDGLQCGYCTPGFIVEASVFHDEWRKTHGTAEPSRDQVAEALAGHLCRCGAYGNIYTAVQAACRGEHDSKDPVPPRHEARAKVTGAALYTVDQRPEGMLWARVLRSPHAHAVLDGLDTSAAQAIAGVKAVYRLVADGETVRFAGQEVCGVAAVDDATAAAAVAAMTASWTVKSFSVTPEDSQAEGATVIWEKPKGAPSAAEGPVLGAKWEGNVRGPFSSSIFGKPKKAAKLLETASEEGRVVSGTFKTQCQIHSALEPHAAVAWWKEPTDLQRGDVSRPTLELWLSTQGVHWVRDEIAQHWKLRRQDISIHAEHVGGAFGSKAVLTTEALVAIELSKAAGAPVRVAWDRAEELTVGGSRPAQDVSYDIAHTADGLLDALRSVSYTNSGVAVGQVSGMVARLLYPSDYKIFDDYDVVTNSPPGKPLRGPGGPPQIFALEQVVDQVAAKTGQDPIGLRRRWDGHAGRLRLYDWVEGLSIWKDRATLPKEGRYREGVGVACANWFAFIARGAQVQIDASGDGIVVSSATQDMGQGSRSVVADNVGRVMGIRSSALTLRFGHSEDVGGVLSGGSRTTASIGPAAAEAAEQLVQEILSLSKDELGWSDAEAVGGGIKHGGTTTPWLEVLASTGPVSVVGKRKRDPGGYYLPMALGGLRITKSLPGAIQLSHVRVDTWTGKVAVVEVWYGMAAGRIHSPVLARSQCIGGVTQGIGYTLYEERRLDPITGQLLTRGMDDYRIPGIGDIPPIHVKFDDVPFDDILGGGIGIAEVCTLPAAASIANAVFDATGWRPTELPIRPDRVLEALS